MLLLTVALLLASSLPAVEYDHGVDFSRYKTWAWDAGSTAPTDPLAHRAIREALTRELEARGVSRVDADASLLVWYDASRTRQIDLVPLEPGRPPDPPTGIRYAETGLVVIELRDAASGKVVWRGRASGKLRYGPTALTDQIEAAVAELLASYPPGE